METPVGLQPGAPQADHQEGPIGRASAAFAADRERSRRVRFVAVGIWNTIFAYGVWALLQFLLGERLHYLLILILAWPIAVLNAYLCHRRLVFRSTGSIRTELPRFSIVYVVTLAASLVLLPILLQVLPFNIYVIQAAFTVAVVVASYLAHRSFSFGRTSAASPSTSHGESR